MLRDVSCHWVKPVKDCALFWKSIFIIPHTMSSSPPLWLPEPGACVYISCGSFSLLCRLVLAGLSNRSRNFLFLYCDLDLYFWILRHSVAILYCCLWGFCFVLGPQTLPVTHTFGVLSECQFPTLYYLDFSELFNSLFWQLALHTCLQAQYSFTCRHPKPMQYTVLHSQILVSLLKAHRWCTFLPFGSL